MRCSRFDFPIVKFCQKLSFFVKYCQKLYQPADDSSFSNKKQPKPQRKKFRQKTQITTRAHFHSFFHRSPVMF